LRWAREQESEIARARQVVKAQGGDLVEKLTKITQHERELEKKVQDLEKKLAEGSFMGPSASGGEEAKTIGEVKVLAKRLPDGTNAGTLRELAEKKRDQLGEKSVVVYGAVLGDKAQLCAMVSKAATDKIRAGDLIKALAKVVGGSGGGRPDMAQAGGTDVGKLDEALEATYAEVTKMAG